MKNKSAFRVHPTINFARFGTSQEYILSPETSAGIPQDNTEVTGGLPIKPGTESEPITSSDLRDSDGLLKKQAARFRIYYYEDSQGTYPENSATDSDEGPGTEVVIGSVINGLEVTDIVWSCHLANKKAASYNVVNNKGIEAYADGKVPQIRNPEVHGEIGDPYRLNRLMIDPGPRVIDSSDKQEVAFDDKTTPQYITDDGQVETLKHYPVRFPADSNDELFEPNGPLDTLGSLLTDDQGRLLVLASSGNAVGQYDEYGVPIQMTGDLNNVGWFDSAADGPVTAMLKLKDPTTGEESLQSVHGSWVVCCDPAYAPQIRNPVSVWDDVYDMFVREMDLQPEIFKVGSGFNEDYTPNFTQDVKPTFIAAELQRWTANLPEMAIRSHAAVNGITEDDNPNETIMAGLNFLRNPNKPETNIGAPLMPLTLGAAGTSFLTVTKTQYFLLEQWSKGKFQKGAGAKLGPGEKMDMASLVNCLGGRYVPGIEVSYTIFCREIYIQDYKESGAGPFRIKAYKLDYSKADNDNNPFLGPGWLPKRHNFEGLEPGDLSKFMAIPWQTDYNSCSIHSTAINTDGVNESNGAESTLYWSWPAQRPDAIYVAEEVINNVLPLRKWSIRGPGTYAVNPASAATFQDPLDSISGWDKIGIIIQGTNIDGDQNYSPELYLEVAGQLTRPGDATDPVPEWPFNANPPKRKTKF